ncbi:hypothetical protein ACFWNL_38915 [Kitasatospora sp. NPDC058397]|uniref:hypothetical protein n=1 Tax=unclassified Kitasatospora TaxID=2633591 RepID=UPI0036671214
MLSDFPVIDAEAFPLHLAIPGGDVVLLQPVARTAHPGLEQAYSEAVFDDAPAVQSAAGVHLAAQWRVAPDRRHVVLILNGRSPRAFTLGVRFAVEDDREREFFPLLRLAATSATPAS